MKVPVLFLGTLLSTIVPATVSFAACPFRQSDLVGTWNSYSTDPINGAWIQCTIVVNSSGNFKARTRCSISSGDRDTVLRGSAKVDTRKCIVVSRIELQSGYIATMTHGTLSLDKSIVQGVGTGSRGSRPFFSIVKR
jgi:hypothetical protein